MHFGKFSVCFFNLLPKPAAIIRAFVLFLFNKFSIWSNWLSSILISFILLIKATILGFDFINGNIVISYSDILFDSVVVKRTLQSNHDISVVVDIDWRGYYVGRKDHPLSEAENVIFNSNNEVEKIGKINTGNEEVHGEFIGMIKLSNRGCEIFKEHFHRLKKLYWNKPFQRAAIFQKAYLTDFIQELVDIGVKIHCVIIESGWKEIDTVEDYKKALLGFNKKFPKN